VSLKQDIERELKVPVRIRMGGPGSLNIFADGQQIFSYQQTKRRPQSAEIIAALRGRT
jgi:hypothetical protein